MSKMKYYAGIGSRNTPISLVKEINYITKALARNNYILRSGGAQGADTYFENGCDLANGDKEIYLPWKNFNGNKSNLYIITEEAKALARKFHPNGNYLTESVLKLMARNCYQVLGKSLNVPVDLVICWTSDGKDSGGTGQALRIARYYKIPVYNLRNQSDINELKEFFKDGL